MKKVYIGIFAHPDDESFGPSGSFLQYIQNGADVHLICATTGQMGANPDGHEDIGAVRHDEWLEAGKLLGAKSQLNLHYHDGELNNNSFHTIAAKIERQITHILSAYSTDTEVIFVTFDTTGISGHIDHIVMSHVTSYVYMNLCSQEQRIKDVHYFCVSSKEVPETNIDYMYMPKGREANEISIINDITTVFDTKKQIMRLHVSQREDAERLIARQESQATIYEYFYTYN